MLIVSSAYKLILQVVQSILETIRVISSALLYTASEFESLLLAPPKYPLLRRLFLHVNNVKFGRHCFFGNGFHLYKSNASLVLGERVCFGEKCGIYAHGDIEIGDDFLAAPGLTINSGSHELKSLYPTTSLIKIGSRVWCGVNVTILSGAAIGDDCIIGANSLVRDVIPSGSVAVGIPAKIIKLEIRESKKVWSCYTNLQNDKTSY